MKYYMERMLQTDFDSAISITKEALKKGGFGMISEINMDSILKEKLNVDFRKYRILGACNPALAYQALQKEDKIGTMLPCNVVVQQLGIDKIEVAVVDPVASMQAVENKDLLEFAETVKSKLEDVVSELPLTTPL